MDWNSIVTTSIESLAWPLVALFIAIVLFVKVDLKDLPLLFQSFKKVDFKLGPAQFAAERSAQEAIDLVSEAADNKTDHQQGFSPNEAVISMFERKLPESSSSVSTGTSLVDTELLKLSPEASVVSAFDAMEQRIATELSFWFGNGRKTGSTITVHYSLPPDLLKKIASDRLNGKPVKAYEELWRTRQAIVGGTYVPDLDMARKLVTAIWDLVPILLLPLFWPAEAVEKIKNKPTTD
ncbi:hypothetical protein [Corynebacterium glutamicum]|uniref:hypothetical protein n=1 Tax=Corynebacterium glutamicum TaxID=1718 RepID=UPI001465C155|nr:hypothetical protein [Corynebacterium glutamicum]NWO07298.1 hypothetical protein [Alteromonadaceae bacterium]GFK18231.1 hypothetical protein KbCgl_08030 [Corynebacterium glutamicum]